MRIRMRARSERVVFAEAFGSACERRCRAETLARRQVEELLRYGWRLA